MQIDSSPRACQVHPAGTPKVRDNTTPVIVWKEISAVEWRRSIYLWKQNMYIWKEAEANCKEIRRSDFDQGKSICLLQAKHPEVNFFLFTLLFGPIFCIKFIPVFSFRLSKTFLLSVFQHRFASLGPVNLVTCMRPLI